MIIGLWAKRREFGAVASVLLLSAKGLLDASVSPKSCLFLLFRQWGCRLLLKMESLQLFNVSKTPLGARFDRTLPPPWILLYFPCGVFLTQPACTCHKRCQLSDFIFTVHFERLSDGQPISESSDTCADRWGLGIVTIVRSSLWHNACQTQAHL